MPPRMIDDSVFDEMYTEGYEPLAGGQTVAEALEALMAAISDEPGEGEPEA